MNISEYINRLNSLNNYLNTNYVTEIIEPANQLLLRAIKYRVFTKGKDSFGNDIGIYSTKTRGFTKDKFVKKSSFNSNTSVMVLKHGYKELKQIQGLKSDKVNLLYSGKLKKSFGANAKSIGFYDFESGNLSRELSRKYNKNIFSAGTNDLPKYNAFIIKNLKKTIKQYLQ